MKQLAHQLSIALSAKVTYEQWDTGSDGWHDYALYVNGEYAGLVVPNNLMELPPAELCLSRLAEQGWL